MILHTKSILISNLILICLLLQSHSAYADLTPKPHIGPAGIEFQSNVGIDYGYDDNVNFQSEKKTNIESDFFNVKPFIQLEGVRGADVYTLQYSGDYRQYQEQEKSTSDNYDDHTIRFIGAWKKGVNNDLLFTIENTLGHENRGEGLTDGLTADQFKTYGIDDVLKTNMFNTEFRYSIDKQDSIGKLSFAAQYKELRYDDRNSDDFHVNNFNQYIKDQNWDQKTFTIELFSQASSRTRFRYSIISNLRDYKEDEQKNTNETFFVAGIKTQQTGKTTIDANIAWLYKTFPNQSDSQNFGGLNWDIDVAWSPVRHSTFHLFTDQSVEDPTEVGGYVLNTKYGTRWVHFWWSNRLSSELGFNYEISEDKEQNDGKKTTTTDATAKLIYKFRPSIILELSYQQLINDSDKEFDDFTINDSAETIIQTLGYDKSIIMFTTKVQI